MVPVVGFGDFAEDSDCRDGSAAGANVAFPSESGEAGASCAGADAARTHEGAHTLAGAFQASQGGHQVP